jgi:molecular chaperone DnaK
MTKLNVVGIDLGTTYSSLARLDRFGQPIAVANAEGEFGTPSVVHFSPEGPIVGTPALRCSVLDAPRTVQNAKRELGDPNAGCTRRSTSRRWCSRSSKRTLRSRSVPSRTP